MKNYEGHFDRLRHFWRASKNFDQASLIFFVARREGTPDTIIWLFVCCKSRILTFPWLVKKQKNTLELSHDWLPLWKCDFRKKKYRVLMNSIMTYNEASEKSEVLSALNASLQSFVYKTLNDEQIKCIHRIAAMGEMFWRCFRLDWARALNMNYHRFRCYATFENKTSVEAFLKFR